MFLKHNFRLAISINKVWKNFDEEMDIYDMDERISNGPKIDFVYSTCAGGLYHFLNLNNVASTQVHKTLFQ